MVAATPTRRPARLDSLTGLRFWFAFLVVLHHSLVHWFGAGAYVVADFGYIGVDFFFVLSGFVLTWSARPGVSPGRFWWNRVARIWPLHLTTLALAVGVGVGVSVHGGWPLMANLLLVQAWVPDRQVFFGFNAVSWSLSCEVFFYLCFPALLVGLRRLRARTRARAGAAIVVAMVGYPGIFSLTAAPHDPAGWEWSTYVLPVWRLGEFAIGIVAALAIRDGWRPRVSGRQALALAAVLAAGFVAAGELLGGLPNRPLAEVVATPVVALVLAALAADDLAADDLAADDLAGHEPAGHEPADRRGRWLASPVMVELGAASYALYLCHALLYGWFVHTWSSAGEGGWRVAGWLGYFGLALGLALALHHLIEAPVERRLRHLDLGRFRRPGLRIRRPAGPSVAAAYPAEPVRDREHELAGSR